MDDGNGFVRVTGPRREDNSYPAEIVVCRPGGWAAFGEAPAFSGNGNPAVPGKIYPASRRGLAFVILPFDPEET